jgi:hypothetical protein
VTEIEAESETVVWLRCASWARVVELDPAGTAPTTDVFVLVEHPLPWPKDIGDDPHLAALQRVASEHAAGRSVRLQAVAVEAGATTRRVVVFATGAPPFTGYGRSEAAGAPDELPGIVADLVAAPPAAPAPAGSRTTDVLVCTHGSRDACCGSQGTRLFMDADGAIDGVRVWRTSHTGGHRFAPTAITFPDGNYWAFLDRPALEGIVDRTLPAAEAATHLRGCAAFSPAAQVADRAVLAQQGWGWLDCARSAEERSPRRVEVTFETPGGERGGYDLLVEEGRMMPVPDCGGDPQLAKKSQPELRVASLQPRT